VADTGPSPRAVIVFTTHGWTQMAARTGLNKVQAREQIREEITTGRAYTPTARNHKNAAPEAWCALEGPKGPGTAVLAHKEADVWVVVTVRDASHGGQGERAQDRGFKLADVIRVTRRGDRSEEDPKKG
jgi:hypothetical protein